MFISLGKVVIVYTLKFYSLEEAVIKLPIFVILATHQFNSKSFSIEKSINRMMASNAELTDINVIL